MLQAWDHSRLPIILVGDSAGGNLAASLSHALRGSSVAIIGQVLIYPGLGGDMDSGSYKPALAFVSMIIAIISDHDTGHEIPVKLRLRVWLSCK